MAQIIRNEPNWGQNLSSALGSLADRKIQQLDSRHAYDQRIKALTGTGNLSRQQAEFLSQFPEKDQFEIAQTLAQQNQPQNPEQYTQAGIPEDMSGLQEFLKQVQPNAQAGQGSLQAAMQQLPQGLPEQLRGSPLENVLRSIEAQRQPQQQLQQQLAQASQAQQLQQQEQRRMQEEEPRQPMNQVEEERPSVPKIKAPLGLTKAQREEQKELQKEANEARKSNQGFLKGFSENYKAATEIHKIASEMRNILKEHKDEFPTGLKSYVPEQLMRNPWVRRYAALSQQLVLAKAAARKGQPTNYKVKMEQMGKVNLTQPLETQEIGLDAEIRAADDVFDEKRLLDDIRKGNRGTLPADVESTFLERVQRRSELPPRAERYEEGSEWQTSDGALFRYKNGAWVEV